VTARHLTIIHYPPRQPHRCVEVRSPAWQDISAAIRQMDDNQYPAILLSWDEVDTCFDDESSLNIFGGIARGFALNEMNGWRLEDPNGSDEEVRLWQSDQGYFCQRKNIINEIDVVLNLAKVYFETGSYDEVRRTWSDILKGGERT
jgi:hypothetical protein